MLYSNLGESTFIVNNGALRIVETVIRLHVRLRFDNQRVHTANECF